jgi:hypothetical protein
VLLQSLTCNCLSCHRCRCANPAACNHQANVSALQHPNYWPAEVSKSLSNLTWEEYGLSLCSVDEGYQGILCGVCRPGFGQTAPFSCSKCLGTQHNSTYPYVQLTPPDLVGISWLYVLYWAVLTVWYLGNVWSSMSTKSRRDQAKPPAQSVLTQGAVSKAVNLDGTPCSAHEPYSRGHVVRSRSMDVCKVSVHAVRHGLIAVLHVVLSCAQPLRRRRVPARGRAADVGSSQRPACTKVR